MKHTIRREVLESRNALSSEFVTNAEEAIFQNLLLAEFSPDKNILPTHPIQQANCIMIYMDFRNEVKTGKIIDYVLSLDKKVVIPSTESGDIIPLLLPDRTDLYLDGFGILSADPAKCERINPSEIDLIIVPGIAFDLSLNRLGFGKGFYDRFLPSLKPETAKIALAYDFQVYDYIPATATDIKMNMIITERRIIV